MTMAEVGEHESVAVGKLSVLSIGRFEPVGRWFEAHCNRQHSKQSLSHHSIHSSSSQSEPELPEDDEDDTPLLKSLDPKEWKKQDHYAVLGLSKLRYAATPDQIKVAYKRKVLKHHPDKRKARGENVQDGDDDYFTCITRAWETLGDPIKKRSFDSVDPEFNDDIPPNNQHSKDNFFAVYGPVFERNARWSTKKQKKVKLGKIDATFEEVNAFYSFWYDLESWREYSYLDEEEKDKGENRDERRWIEKQNKAERVKRKKEETARIRSLVDNAYASDPRVQRFKEEEKEKKLAAKKARQDAVRAKQEEAERLIREGEEAERLKKEKEEEEIRLKKEKEKKERDALKKIMKKEKKIMRNKLKDYDYFTTDAQEKIQHMQDMEKLAEFLSATSIKDLNEGLISDDKEKAKASFDKHVGEMNAHFEEERKQHMGLTQKQGGGKDKGGGGGGGGKSWGEEETQLLIKGVNLFPAGTVQRWETIANFITQRLPDSRRSGKEVLARAKQLQKMDGPPQTDRDKQAYEKLMRETKSSVEVPSDTSQRFESVAEQQIAETGTNPAPWTAEEQRLLEQALKSYPASTPNRWETIAEAIPYRSKKDCMVRYKELVELVRAKKAAAAATQKAKKS